MEYLRFAEENTTPECWGGGSNGDDFAESRGLLRATVIQNKLCTDPASCIRHSDPASTTSRLSVTIHRQTGPNLRDERRGARIGPRPWQGRRHEVVIFWGVRISRHPNHGWRNRGDREVPSPPGPINFISWVEHRWTQYICITKMDPFYFCWTVFQQLQ